MEISLEPKKKLIPGGNESLSQKIQSALTKDLDFFERDFSDKKKERFYSEMNVLLSAGIDIKTAMELIEDEQVKEKDKQLFQQINKSLISGEGLSSALRSTNKFSPYEYYTLQIGEESGKVNEVLADLALYFSGKIKQKRQVTSALSYPVIVLLSVAGVMAFMMKVMVPMFSDIFKRFNGELPFMTKVVIKMSDFFSNYFWISILTISIVIIICYTQRRSDTFRNYTSRFILKIPVVKDMVSKIYLARFCHSMNLLIAAKTPLVHALDLVKKMIGYYPIEVSIEPIRERILKGDSLHKSLSAYSIYNKRLISLIKVAEEVNQLDKMFERLAKQYNDDVEHQTGILGSLIEPFMILFLGLVVGFILVAMYLPIFQLSTSVGN